MNKSNSIEAIDKTNLCEQTKFQLVEISKIENYFIKEINQRKLCSKKLNKYDAISDYIGQALIVLSAAPVGIASASLTLFFCLTTGIVKKSINITRKKKRKSMIKF